MNKNLYFKLAISALNLKEIKLYEYKIKVQQNNAFY